MSDPSPTLPLALTMGDPAGIGGELTLQAWCRHRDGAPMPSFFAIDDPARLTALSGKIGQPVPVAEIATPEEAATVFDRALPVLPQRLARPPVAGRPDPANAPAVIESIERAVKLAEIGLCTGVVTNPINKKVLYDAGFAYPGHTEFLAALAQQDRHPVMMLVNAQLRVVPLTTHMALRDVFDALTPELIVTLAQTVDFALRQDFGIDRPRLAFAGLNPHAGEGGTLGREEIEIFAPALKRLRAEGIDARGPHAADTLFHEDARSNYDVALCGYHDQALIPVKTLDFHGGVNVTLGLPIIRTSPDHGTAFDIAGTGTARPDSLIAALRLAGDMAANRRETA